jgi:hypothetical protein
VSSGYCPLLSPILFEEHFHAHFCSRHFNPSSFHCFRIGTVTSSAAWPTAAAHADAAAPAAYGAASAAWHAAARSATRHAAARHDSPRRRHDGPARPTDDDGSARPTNDHDQPASASVASQQVTA